VQPNPIIKRKKATIRRKTGSGSSVETLLAIN